MKFASIKAQRFKYENSQTEGSYENDVFMKTKKHGICATRVTPEGERNGVYAII